jgi:hypothetical protein
VQAAGSACSGDDEDAGACLIEDKKTTLLKREKHERIFTGLSGFCD